jgi:hypothetical protein
MATRLVLEGLDELKAALRALPDRLRDQAAVIVRLYAARASDEITRAYPDRAAGELGEHMQVRTEAAGRFGVVVAVRNTSRLAWIFENGTRTRQTKLGANRGVMPPGHVFFPLYYRYRRDMNDALVAMLEREGLIVTGSADD